MATTNELIRSLPTRVYYLGEPYTLLWSTSLVDGRCLKLQYVSDYDEVLCVDESCFYIETERHYATYAILQMLLQHAPDVLGYVWYENQHTYNTIINKMYDNALVLYNYCTQNTPRTGRVTYETREYV